MPPNFPNEMPSASVPPLPKKNIGRKILIVLLVLFSVGLGIAWLNQGPAPFIHFGPDQKVLLSVQCERGSLDLVDRVYGMNNEGDLAYHEKIELIYHGGEEMDLTFASYPATDVDFRENIYNKFGGLFSSFPIYFDSTKHQYRIFKGFQWGDTSPKDQWGMYISIEKWIIPATADRHINRSISQTSELSSLEFNTAADCLEQNLDSLNTTLRSFRSGKGLLGRSASRVPSQIVSIVNFTPREYENDFRRFICTNDSGPGTDYSSFVGDVQKKDGKLTLSLKEAGGSQPRVYDEHAFYIEVWQVANASEEIARTCVNSDGQTVDQYVSAIEESLRILGVPENLIASNHSGPAKPPDVRIDESSLTTNSSHPTISGTADWISSVFVSLADKGEVLWHTENPVRPVYGKWSVTISIPNYDLPPGQYTILVSGPDNPRGELPPLATGTLTVSK